MSLANVINNQSVNSKIDKRIILQFHERLSRNGFDVQLRQVWASVGMTITEYGWKLHLSSVQQQAFSLLDAVIPILKSYNVPFKIARDSNNLGWLNEGVYGSTQVGKFVTIYPSSNDEALSIANNLIAITSDFSGPMIVTDLYLGGVVYARYGSFSAEVTRDRLGNIVNLNPSESAEYKVPFIPPKDIPNPFSAFVKTKNLAVTNSNVIGPGYLIVRALSVNAKGSVFQAINLQKQDNVEFVVLKEGRHHCLSDLDGRDIQDRLRHQYQIHKILAGKVPIPEAKPLFEHANNLYLPLSYIEGKDFEQFSSVPYISQTIERKISLLNELKELCSVVKRLHSEGIIHRDLTARNVRVTEQGKIFLLDLELSHSVGDSKSIPFTEGTPGFVSPQQIYGEEPTFTDDIYSLGALILMAITGLDPQKVIFVLEENNSGQICDLSGASESLCSIVSKCISKTPDSRPSIDEILIVLEQGIIKLTEEPESDIQKFESKKPSVKNSKFIYLGLQWLLSDASKEKRSGLWTSPEIEAAKTGAGTQLSPNFCLYRSINRGVSGVIYVLSRLHRMGYKNSLTTSQTETAIDWLLNHDITPDDQMPGLHFGECGVAVSIAEAINAELISSGEWVDSYFNEALTGPIDWPDLTHGAAGQGIASLICSTLLNKPNLALHSKRCADYLIERQEFDGSWKLPKGVPGMEGAIYTGFAHGVAGIVYFLTKYAKHFASKDAEKAARQGCEWLLQQKHKSQDGKSFWWPKLKNDNEPWYWWCHGSPGISLAFLSLFELTGELKYSEIVPYCLRVHPLNIRYNNLSQCHGLSGFGEILLDAYRVLKEPEWLIRAQNIGKTLRALAKIDADGASWLVENPIQPTADLMIGCSGIVHFLARLEAIPDIQFGMPLLI